MLHQRGIPSPAPSGDYKLASQIARILRNSREAYSIPNSLVEKLLKLLIFPPRTMSLCKDLELSQQSVMNDREHEWGSAMVIPDVSLILDSFG
ncbi:uncharacterized protein VTP21DRAFT_8303 [Calcarisporiella thermophila]|uniref:uncharacterized protein n=1 Tax=Calcarisporiella thermophila TaxID=911321 RepID=UPI003744686A